MEYTIITYGSQEVMGEVFNAIASLVNSETGTIYKSLIYMGLSLGLMWSVAFMLYGDKTQFFKSWLVPFYLSLTLLFAPTARVHIKDPTNLQPPITVDHVPWGLAMVAGNISTISHRITQRIESVFSAPQELQYNKTGTLFASNLILNSTKFKITDPDLQDTMRSYVNQCIFYDALIGRKYTMRDLKHSGNIWALASANPSPARSFLFKEPGLGKTSEILTCRAGTARLKPYLDMEVENAFSYFGGMLFGSKPRPGRPMIDAGAELKKFLPISYGYMTGMANSAADIMRQQIMLSAVEDTADAESAKYGNPTSFAAKKAYLHQRMSQQTTFAIAMKKLLAMKNVMEILIYVSFIFIVPMAMLPKGWTFVSKWVGLLLWISLWPPLYAVLNFLVNAYASNKGAAHLHAMSPDGISLASSIGFTDLHADMSAQAGFLTLSVASLSYALVKGGAASFVHLAGHMASSTTAAASKAAEENLSGNYSFGNITEGTVQARNTNFGQHNFAPSLATGYSTVSNGMVSRTTTSDGENLLTIGNSKLRSDINMSESMSTSLSEQGSKTESLAQSQLIESAQSQAEAYRQVSDLSAHQARSENSGTSSVTSESVSDRESLSKVHQLTDKFAKDNSITYDKAAQAIARASVEGSVGFSLLGSGITAKGSLEGNIQTSKSDRELFGKAKDFVEQTGLNKSLDHTVQAVKDQRLSATDDMGSRYTKGINQSSDKADSLREAYSVNHQKAENYSKSASWVQQHGSSINRNMNQGFVNWLQTQPAPGNNKGRMGIQAAQHILSRNDNLALGYQQRYIEEQTRNPGEFLQKHGYNASAPSYSGPSVGTGSTSSNPSTTSSGLESQFKEAKSGFSSPTPQGTVSAESQGFGEAFSLDKSTESRTTNLMNQVSDRIEDLENKLDEDSSNHKSKLFKNGIGKE